MKDDLRKISKKRDNNVIEQKQDKLRETQIKLRDKI